MKRFFRLGPVQSTLAFLLTAYVLLVQATMRWRFDQSDLVVSEMARPEGGMLFFWHGRIALAVTCRRLIRAGNIPDRAGPSFSLESIVSSARPRPLPRWRSRFFCKR